MGAKVEALQTIAGLMMCARPRLAEAHFAIEILRALLAPLASRPLICSRRVYASGWLEGRADIASLDAVTWRFALQIESFAAVESAIHALSAESKRYLGVHAIERIKKSRYLATPRPDIPECRLDSK